MAKVGTQRAAELTGKSKSTIQRAMKNGKISFEINQNGHRVVDVSELERAFGLAPQDDKKEQSAVEAELENAKNMLEIERLKMRIKFLEEQIDLSREQIEDLKEQREEWQKQAQQVLITSQYSQKQAEEYKAALQERQRRARERKKQALEKRMQSMQGKNQNEASSKHSGPIQGFLNKIKGHDNDQKQANG